MLRATDVAVRDSGIERLLVVDDAPELVAMLSEVLRPTYVVLAATNGVRALQLARAEPRPDLILLDVVMPGADGFETLGRLRSDPETREIPVIFMTARSGASEETAGLEAGAADFLPKPLVAAVVRARVRLHLDLAHARDRLKRENAFLDAEVARRMAENREIQDVAIRALAHLAETRDPETGRHLLRTRQYVQLLARRLREAGLHTDVLTDAYIELLSKSAPLHDIGKVGVSDLILLKPGPLTPEEWTVMRRHPVFGFEALERAEADTAGALPFLAVAKQLVRSHHEKWNGTGYPDALAGDAIPLPARLMALADVFDALTTRRPYKEPLPIRRAHEIVLEGRGSHFDPDVVDAYVAVADEFAAIAARWADRDESLAQKQAALALARSA